jgi:multiple sugar transport system permease protein
MVGSLGLNASLAGIVLPNLANAFGIFLMRQFIAGVPDEMIDAARMDGASELVILYTIVAPSVAPAIAALELFAFVYPWDSYLWPLTVLQGNADAESVAELQPRRRQHRPGDGRRDARRAAATRALRLPAALLRGFDRGVRDQGVGQRRRRDRNPHSLTARR